MALPYATAGQLEQLKNELEKKIKTSGSGSTGTTITKVSELENDAGYITSKALEGYATTAALDEVKASIPSIEGLATKDEVTEAVKEVEGKIPDVSGFALKTELPDVSGLATKEELTEATKDSVKYQTFQNPNDDAPRKTIQLANHDTISGVATTGSAHNLIMLSKWDKVDVGAAGVTMNLNGKDARPTYNDEKELALTEDIPDISNLASKEELSELEAKIPTVPDTSSFATKEEVEEVKASIPSVEGLVNEDTLASTIGEERKAITKEIETATSNLVTNETFTTTLGNYALKSELPNTEEFVKESELPDFSTYALKTEIPEVDGFATKAEVNALIKTEGAAIQVGNEEHGINLNGSAERPTYKGIEELALVSDLEWIPVICNMPFRTLADKVYTQEEIFAWFFVEDIFGLKDTIVKHPIYLRYGISLSYNPMYYYIPCQYVAFTDANTVEMITDGLDTRNDKFSRYHITIKLDGTVINSASNIKVELKENVFVPDLPEDASSKTYQLKAVNGTLSWVE